MSGWGWLEAVLVSALVWVALTSILLLALVNIIRKQIGGLLPARAARGRPAGTFAQAPSGTTWPPSPKVSPAAGEAPFPGANP